MEMQRSILVDLLHLRYHEVVLGKVRSHLEVRMLFRPLAITGTAVYVDSGQ